MAAGQLLGVVKGPAREGMGTETPGRARSATGQHHYNPTNLARRSRPLAFATCEK